MRMQYKYFVVGDFKATDGNVYCCEVPMPPVYSSFEEAEHDPKNIYYGIRFALKDEPVILVFENEKFTITEDNQGREILIAHVEGEVVKQYTYEEFLAENGKLKIKQLAPKGNFVIGGEFDYIPTQKTFCEIFPNMEKDKLYYVEDDSFYVEEQKTE